MVAAFGSKKAITMTGVFLALWFSLILVIDLLELFGPSNTDLYTYLAILIPVAIFAAGYIGVAGFRRFLLSLDLRLLTIVQCWRVVGAASSSFMPLNVLPGVWAFPAAFGDIAMGVTAPIFAMSLIRGNPFPRMAFIVWNLLGILDFVVAAVLGLAIAESLGIRSGEISTQPLTVLPLSLFPTFIVPFFVLVHLTALVQIVKRVDSRSK